MKLRLLSVCAIFAAAVVSAQPVGPFFTARSYSGQFTVQERRLRNPWAPAPRASRVPIAGSLAFLVTAPPISPLASSAELSLEPATLTITCERIKGLFLLELGVADAWKGKISVILDRSMTNDQPPILTGLYGSAGWNYELDLPPRTKPETLVQAVVQTLLTEIVNRNAGSHSAEVPFWLSEGLSAHLQAYNLPTFIVRPNVQSAGYQEMRIEGLESVRAGLRRRAPLSFQQLSWPDQSDITGENRAPFRCCAQLFLESLLHLKDGRACLLEMLKQLPQHLNWQTSFLTAFHPHFSSLLDVEKWWGLNCVSFTATDFAAPATEREFWHKLRETLDVPVQVHLDSTHLPAEARLTLQEVITQWSAGDALPVLQRAARGLEDLQLFTFRCDLSLDRPDAAQASQQNARGAETAQWRLAKELNPLVTSYLLVVLDYIKKSQYDAPLAAGVKGPESSLRILQEKTVKQLNQLDEKREALRAGFSPAVKETKLSEALPAPAFR